ncbi:MAG: hypothetical protein HY431_01475 [Candidatus Levybacteria bacterium]|nr:hypothetical protein [Candidatus Levybacteria bacterium]
MQAKSVLGSFEEGIEKGVKRQFKHTAQAVKGQFSSQKTQQSQSGQTQDSGTNEQAAGAAQQGQQQPTTDQFAKEFIEDMYASTANNQQPTNDGQQTGNKQPSAYFQQLTQKGYTPEEAQKLESLRKKLHDETYYIPLTKRQPQQEEERPAEKVEREKMEELQHEDEKKKKEPPPLAVQMASNKAERFPGVSG